MRVRFGYEPGGSSPRVGFCDSLNTSMAELNVLLEKAYALGLAGDGRIQQAAYVFDQNNDFWTRKWFTVPLTDQCATMSGEVWNAVATVRAVLGSSAPPPLRPDYVASDPFAMPTWLPWVLGLGAAAWFLSSARGFVPQRSLSGYRRGRR